MEGKNHGCRAGDVVNHFVAESNSHNSPFQRACDRPCTLCMAPGHHHPSDSGERSRRKPTDCGGGFPQSKAQRDDATAPSVGTGIAAGPVSLIDEETLTVATASIWVDADACSSVIKDILCRAAERMRRNCFGYARR